MADHYSIHRLSLAGIVEIRLGKKGGGGDEAVYSRLERAGDSGNLILSERSGVTYSSIHVAKQQTYKRINGQWPNTRSSSNENRIASARLCCGCGISLTLIHFSLSLN